MIWAHPTNTTQRRLHCNAHLVGAGVGRAYAHHYHYIHRTKVTVRVNFSVLGFWMSIWRYTLQNGDYDPIFSPYYIFRLFSNINIKYKVCIYTIHCWILIGQEIVWLVLYEILFGEYESISLFLHNDTGRVKCTTFYVVSPNTVTPYSMNKCIEVIHRS